jgi:hypothetical protein
LKRLNELLEQEVNLLKQENKAISELTFFKF